MIFEMLLLQLLLVVWLGLAAGFATTAVRSARFSRLRIPW
jgi:hypothetical protein